MERHGAAICYDAGRSPLGAPPWRFWASGPRFSHRHPPLLTLQRASDRAQRAPRSQVVVPGGRLPGPPGGEQLRATRRGTPRLALHSGSSLEHALSEQGWKSSSTASFRSQEINSICIRTTRGFSHRRGCGLDPAHRKCHSISGGAERLKQLIHGGRLLTAGRLDGAPADLLIDGDTIAAVLRPARASRLTRSESTPPTVF